MSTRRLNWRILFRKVHYWGSIIIAIPLIIVICTGILLLVKKEFTWVQPKTIKANSHLPTPSFLEILDAVKMISKVNVKSWKDIDRLDIRPNKGVIKIRCKNSWEVQLNYKLKILQIAYRRSDFIESLHDGSFFGKYAKFGIFLPAAIILLLLWLTGIYLFWLPIQSRIKKRKKQKKK